MIADLGAEHFLNAAHDREEEGEAGWDDMEDGVEDEWDPFDED